MPPVEPTVYEGTASQIYNSNLLAHTLVEYLPEFRQVIVDQVPLLKAWGVAAFGKRDIVPGGSFGNVKKDRDSTGQGIVFHDGGPQFEGPLYTTRTAGTHVGQMGNIAPAHNSPAVTWAYAYKRLYWSIYVPEEFVDDNKGNARLMNRLENEMKLAQMGAAEDLDYILTEHSSAPSSNPKGLPNLISVTQSSATNAGNITPTTTNYWCNQYRACTSVGGGGELDRPLVFIRTLESLMLDIRAKGGSSDSQVLAGTRGAYQYYRRAGYADTSGQGNANLRNQAYDAAKIDHQVFMGSPFIYDANVQVPTGATASTEAVYVQDLRELGLHVKRAEFFDVDRWDPPRPKDRQRFYQTNIWLRYIPAVTNRRIQGVLYNLPANPDAA